MSMSSGKWCMNKTVFHQWDRKYKNKIKPRNAGAEKYNNWTEKFTRGIQQQTWSSRRLNEVKNRSSEIIRSEEHQYERMKKNEESLKVLWDINKWISIPIMEVPEREKGQKTYFKKK